MCRLYTTLTARNIFETLILKPWNVYFVGDNNFLKKFQIRQKCSLNKLHTLAVSPSKPVPRAKTITIVGLSRLYTRSPPRFCVCSRAVNAIPLSLSNVCSFLITPRASASFLPTFFYLDDTGRQRFTISMEMGKRLARRRRRRFRGKSLTNAARTSAAADSRALLQREKEFRGLIGGKVSVVFFRDDCRDIDY